MPGWYRRDLGQILSVDAIEKYKVAPPPTHPENTIDHQSRNAKGQYIWKLYWPYLEVVDQDRSDCLKLERPILKPDKI